MKSLEEREKFRQKQRAENHAKAVESGDAVSTNQRSVTKRDVEGTPVRVPAEGEGNQSDEDSEDSKEADAFVDRTVEVIKGELDNLTLEQLDLVEAAEKRGNKKRASVYDAISAQRKARANAGASWGAGK